MDPYPESMNPDPKHCLCPSKCLIDARICVCLVKLRIRVGQAAGDPRYALLTINVRTFVVQVPVKPDGLPEPQVTHVTPSTTRERFTLPKKLICMNTNGSYTAETHQVQ
jgi:hypothetical protein